jgi:threonine dehydrogenase-like Zn-dependent dehydrogenase
VDNYDVVVEATGSSSALPLAISLVVAGGILVLKSTYPGDANGVPLSRIVVKEITLMGSRCGPFHDSIRALTEGRVNPCHLIDTIYPLHDAEKAFAHASKPGTYKILLRPTTISSTSSSSSLPSSTTGTTTLPSTSTTTT